MIHGPLEMSGIEHPKPTGGEPLYRAHESPFTIWRHQYGERPVPAHLLEKRQTPAVVRTANGRCGSRRQPPWEQPLAPAPRTSSAGSGDRQRQWKVNGGYSAVHEVRPSKQVADPGVSAERLHHRLVRGTVCRTCRAPRVDDRPGPCLFVNNGQHPDDRQALVLSEGGVDAVRPRRFILVRRAARRWLRLKDHRVSAMQEQ